MSLLDTSGVQYSTGWAHWTPSTFQYYSDFQSNVESHWQFCCPYQIALLPYKSWDKHDLNEVASSILAHTILKKLLLSYQKYTKTACTVYYKSWIYFYINITTLPRLWATLQVMLCCGIELVTSLRSCLSQFVSAQRKSFMRFRIHWEIAVNYGSILDTSRSWISGCYNTNLY